MKLARKLDKALTLGALFAVVFGLVFVANSWRASTYADNGSEYEEWAEHYVTLEDGEQSVIVKTSARTVGELLKRAGVVLTEADVVNPGLDTEIDAEMTVGIWRARPVVIKDGVREKYFLTTESDAREIVVKYGEMIYEEDEVAFTGSYDFLATGPAYVYEVTRNHVEPEPEPEVDLTSKLNVRPLTAVRGVNMYMVSVGGKTVQRKETFYDLPMGGVMSIAARECQVPAYYEVREDGVKVDAEGYILVAADLNRYPRCTVVDTSLGLGRVYDTGSFALSNPEQFDIATDWTNRNGK